MLGREVFASYRAMQRGRVRTPQFQAGVAASLTAHILFIILTYPSGINLGGAGGTGEALGGPGFRGEIVEVTTPVVFPSPRVVRQALGETPETEPRHPKFIAVKSSLARGEPNANPSGSPDLPKGTGENPGLSASGGPGGGTSQPSGEAGMAPSHGSQPSPVTKRDERKVVEATDRMPTIAFEVPKDKPGDREGRDDVELPAEGGGPDLAGLPGVKRDEASSLLNPESLITLQGPISVNAKGVGPIEEYRAYLEQAIQRRWQIPAEANLLSQPIALTIEFEITRDGRVLAIRLHNSTGVRALDRAAMRAIELASPFRPLPVVFVSPSQLFTDTFVYYPPKSN